MIVLSGKNEVWKHAEEAGIQDDIKMIAKYFDIKDVSIIFNGKLTYLHDMPRKTHRIAVATRSDMTTADAIKSVREKKR